MKQPLNACDCPLSFLKLCLEDFKKAKDKKRIKRMEEIIAYSYPK